MQNISSIFRQFCKLVWLGLALTSGCIRLERINTETPTTVEVPTEQSILASRTPHYGWTDANDLMEGICFEAALDAAGRIFQISNASALEAFYSQVDHSQLCEEPVNRIAYPFTNNEMIVGFWSKGTGCTARHEVQNVLRDDAQKQEAIQLLLITEGDCPYELVQPFWIALPQAADFNVHIEVQSLP